jgi:ABC-type multidrug transport system ATPase subunit/pSer/pThr/pTyr-binding forkhead associated (FHA) protein
MGYTRGMSQPPTDRLRTVTLGKDPQRVDWVAQNSTVSSVHCRLWTDAEGTWWMEDAGSTNGTFLRGMRLPPHVPHTVHAGDVVRLGRQTQFEVGDPLWARWDDPTWTEARLLPLLVREPFRAMTTAMDPSDLPFLRAEAMASTRSTVAAPVVFEASDTHVGQAPARPPVTGGVRATAPVGDQAVSLSLGYAPTNDVVIPQSVVSQRHARLYLEGDRLVLEDLGSTNGVWIGEQRIQLSAVQVGQAFRLGSHELTVLPEWFQLLRERQRAQRARTVALPALAAPSILRVGRGADNDIVLQAPVVSTHHAELRRLPGRDAFQLTDLNSTNGTWLNSREHRITDPVVVEADDILYFGSYRFPASRALAWFEGQTEAARADAAPADGRRVFRIGREAALVDVVIDRPPISRVHAEITPQADGTFLLRDLDSANGTFVDGERLRGSLVVRPDQRVSLGGIGVTLDAAQGIVRDSYRGDIVLQAQRISVDVPDPTSPGGARRILSDVSFTVYPTEFVGLMGPSGAGKTTLMLALNGYTPPSQGRAQLNGQDLYAHYNSFRGTIGYVPQDDIVFPQLTVWESLWYTARLRLPGDTSRADIERRIEDILDKLEIAQTRNVVIGDALRKGISGGQRKRVNLAQELITEPSLLFLDEPTSGLASEDTINVMRLLRQLADSGKTILLTIHQPSLEAYRLMDNIVYLYEGRLVYYGPAHPDSILYFHPEVGPGPARETLLADPGNALKVLAAEQRQSLAQGDASLDARSQRLKAMADHRAQRYLSSPQGREFVHDRASGASLDDVEVTRASIQRTQRRGVWRQWAILTERAARIQWKDRANTFILLAQAPIIAAVLAAVFASPDRGAFFTGLQRGPAALFLLVASAVWFGCSNSAREIVRELAIYRRERMVNLMIPSYVLSKFTVLGVVCAVQCALLLAIVYLPLGLEGALLPMFGTLLLTSLVGLGMGLTLSALVRSPEAAMGLVPLLLIPQIILGGVIMPVQDMNAPMKVLSHLTAARWGYEALLHLEYGDEDLDALRTRCEIPACVWGLAKDGWTYYPADPTSVTQAESRSGVTAFAEAQAAPVEPRDEAVCLAFCSGLRNGQPLTPLDRSFGADPDEGLRAQARADLADMPWHWTEPAAHARWGLRACLAVLAGGILTLLALVMALLKARDVEVG